MFKAEFQKVTKKQFQDDLKQLLNLDDDHFDNVVIPTRSTTKAAGYDFIVPCSVVIKPQQMVKVPTGIRCYMEDEYVLQLYPRSSTGIKHNIMLANTVGIIDADYYNADNQGHIIIALYNYGDKDFIISKGDKVAQGLITKYYKAKEEKVTTIRVGGLGSTGK